MRRLHFAWSHGQAVCHCSALCCLRAELLQYAAGWNAGAPTAAGGDDSDEVGDELLDRCGMELPTDTEEPRVTSVLQQDYPEVVGLGVTVSDVVEFGDTKPEVVDLGW